MGLTAHGVRRRGCMIAALLDRLDCGVPRRRRRRCAAGGRRRREHRTSSTADAPESTPIDRVPTSSPPSTSRRRLTIGTLLPATGPGNPIGLAGINAVNVGVRQINEAGGVLGQPVQLVTASEGTSVDDARAGIEKLLASNVDAIIGPASSLVTLEVLDELMDAGVVVCSPTATALALNDYPNRDLFFRTVPSDSLTGQAMAIVALNTGVDSYAVVYLDDQFGRPFAREAIEPPRRARGRRPVRAAIPVRRHAGGACRNRHRSRRAVAADDRADRRLRTRLGDAPGTRRRVRVRSDPPSSSSTTRCGPRRPRRRCRPAAEFREAIQGVSPVVPPDVRSNRPVPTRRTPSTAST